MGVGVRVAVVLAALLVLSGCESGAKRSAPADATAAPRAERCTQRILEGIEGNRGPMVRSYIERTYCDRFARRGWVYADGALSIKAHLWLMNAGTCSESTSGGPAVTVPCEPSFDPLECALLHYVRRAEVQAYIRKLAKTHRVRCDDGTPLEQLGAA
jgi:hypothetical protein